MGVQNDENWNNLVKGSSMRQKLQGKFIFKKKSVATT